MPKFFGILNIDKPRGMTSHDVVARIRRLIGEKRVGHGGTLDPDATGVLPVLVGKATKLSQFVLEMDKTYRAEMTLGTVTDTQDASGSVVDASPECLIKTEDLYAVLNQFVGNILQTPPMVSAVRVGGKRLYELARAGIDTPRDPRPVRIKSLEVKDIQGVSGDLLQYGSRVVLDVTCSKGTYIRTLCHDIGQAIHCGAHMSALKRLRVGPFRLEAAMSLEDVAASRQVGRNEEIFLSPEIVFQDVARIVVTSDEAKRLKNGQAIVISQDRLHPSVTEQSDLGVIHEVHRKLICVARFDQQSERLRPVRVF